MISKFQHHSTAWKIGSSHSNYSMQHRMMPSLTSSSSSSPSSSVSTSSSVFKSTKYVKYNPNNDINSILTILQSFEEKLDGSMLYMSEKRLFWSCASVFIFRNILWIPRPSYYYEANLKVNLITHEFSGVIFCGESSPS